MIKGNEFAKLFSEKKKNRLSDKDKIALAKSGALAAAGLGAGVLGNNVVPDIMARRAMGDMFGGIGDSFLGAMGDDEKAEKAFKRAEKKINRAMNVDKRIRASKILGAAGLAAGLSAGGYTAYKHFKNKKKESDKK